MDNAILLEYCITVRLDNYAFLGNFGLKTAQDIAIYVQCDKQNVQNLNIG